MLISKREINKILNVFLLFLILFSVLLPFRSALATVTLTPEALQPASVVLKATGLTPGETVMLWVASVSPTPTYLKEENTTVNNQGWAFHLFTGLSSSGTYTGHVTAHSGVVANITFTTPKSSEKSIKSFSVVSGITPIAGIINDFMATVSLTAPSGADVTSLTPTIIVSDKATIDPTSLAPQNFTNPVTYKVTAEDGSIRNYLATIVIANPTTPPTCVAPQVLDPTTNTCVTPSVNTKTTYTLLTPLPGMGLNGTSQTIDTQKSDTNPCPFGKYLNILIKLFLGICGVLAVVMIVMGGIEYMTSELASSKEAGKESIRNAILGLLLALGAYLILNTINPNLLNVCLNTLPVATITIDPEQIVGDTPPPTGGKICNGEYQKGDVWPTDYTARAQLLNQGISVKMPSCSNSKVGDPGCTSVYNLNTLGVIKLEQSCNKYINGTCEAQITGGTECWLHGSNPKKVHMPGGSSVDLHESPSLKNYVTQNGKNSPQMVPWIGGAKYPMYIVDGMKLVDESDHYHVYSY
jgi:hypothetical protein